MSLAGGPVVSVITPLHDSVTYIGDTIRSVIEQTFNDWEMIIVDDGSTDRSVDVAEAFRQQDDRIELIRLGRNHGPAVARNTGIEAARGRYIAFLDSDDQWLPTKLERQIAFMQKNHLAFTCTYYEKLSTKGRRSGKVVMPPLRQSYADMLKSNRVGCLSVVYDTMLLGKVLMPLIRKRQDYGLWLKILRSGFEVHCLPEVLALYRIRPGSISENKFEMLKYNWRLYRKVEKLTLHASLYYIGWNIFRKVVE